MMNNSLKSLILLLPALLLPATAATAATTYDFEVGGIYYNYGDGQGTAEVTRSPERYSGDVIIPAAVTHDGTTYSVTAIGTYAFSSCANLTSVSVPNSVLTIGSNAFSYCDGLTNMPIGNAVTTIGDAAFAGCEGLTSATIPSSVTSIGDDVFWDCI